MRTRVLALEVVVGRLDAEVALEPVEVVGERVDEVGLDRVLDDRVALLGDLAAWARRRSSGRP